MPATADPQILIADDTPANLRLLRQTLGDESCELLIATDGVQTLKTALARRPDLILLDVLMPEMDGYAVCRRLKADPATRDIPVIFITARDDAESVREGFAAGGVDYITKPFEEVVVLARVRTQLEMGRLRRALAAETARREEAEAALGRRA